MTTDRTATTPSEENTTLSDLCPELFHYTSFEGIKAIFNSQSLWAKDFRNLNDSSEVFHAKAWLFDQILSVNIDLAKTHENEIANAVQSFGGIKQFAEYQSFGMTESLFNAVFGEKSRSGQMTPYILSLCQHTHDHYSAANGLLSMWRGYGRDGGVAIVFETSGLAELIIREWSSRSYLFISFGSVVYGDDRELMERAFETTSKLLPEFIKASFEESLDTDLFEATVKEFVTFATRLKHPAFHEEREIRVVAVPIDHELGANLVDQELLKKVHKHGSGSFIHLFEDDDIGPLPIKRVIVGPHPEQDLRVRELQDFLPTDPDIEVTASDTPFVHLGSA